ncbi:MAG TPA: carboxypeptidase regulatory-like domain-containing protein [Streptosporangiaceae bacterium]|jgi:hypothetical protein
MSLTLVASAPANAASVTPSSAAAQPVTTPQHPARGVTPQKDTSGSKTDYARVCGAPKAGAAACLALLRTNVKAHKGITPDVTPSGYGPGDLQSAYNLPSATAGSGATVAVVDAGDDPTAEADLGVYRAQYGLPPCTTANGCFEKVNQEGQQGNYPPSVSGWPTEESLDVDMVSAACPNCHILLVEANSALVTDLGASVDEAVALGAQYVSNSYGVSESTSELQWDAYYNHPGVAVTASAGDYGYGVLYPAASQYVTAVGGTTLTRDSSVPRGWDETAWGSNGGLGTGSGCSAYEPKPSWQTDTGCANRTLNDVSADADPNTGVAVYDTADQGGWLVVGGTSAASPLIASTYALAGTPTSAYPNSYPYADPSALNDITSGLNGTCTPAYLCTAGSGYDGPTGLGTPDGVAAFSGGPHGDVTGQVTDASTGDPIAGAQVSTDGGTTVTGADGDYTLILPVGTYNVTAADYGYASQTADGVAVTQGASVTENYALTALPTTTLSGKVTDGSGHGWPLYATVTVADTPGAPVYTNPYTGRYSITLPQSATYKLQVTPVTAGYQTVDATLRLGTTAKTRNVAVPVDASACTAPGYAFSYQGMPMETFDADSLPTDWTQINAPGTGRFWSHETLTAGVGPNNAGGTGGDEFANAFNSGGGAMDSSLASPAISLSGVTSPIVGFDTSYTGAFSTDIADVDLSLDGGQSWTNIWEQTAGASGPTQITGPIQISIPQAAGQPDVQIRFRAQAPNGGGLWWAIDNVYVGTRGCAPTPGGLIAGVVTDANTGQPVDAARVSSVSAPSDSGITATTPQNPNLRACLRT